MQFDSIKALPIDLKYNVENHNRGNATYFRSVVGNYMLKWCEERGIDLYGDGLKIYTTIDSRMQKYAEEAVNKHMKELQGKFFAHWKGRNPWVDENYKEIKGFIENAARRSERYRELKAAYGDDEKKINEIMNKPIKMRVFSWKGEIDTVMSPMDSIRYYKHFLHAGLMSMTKDGQIKAWVGGINHKHFKYDHVYQGKRQTGSTFKPFVYAAAIENGFTPCLEVDDLPVTIPLETGDTWTPSNSDGPPSGERMTIRQGLARSINTIVAYVYTKVGPAAVIDMASRLGIDKANVPAVPSIALGVVDVNIFDMVGAYNTFSNGGVHVRPYYITRIEDKYGNLLQEFIPKTSEVLNSETADLMIYMLKGSTQERGGSGLGLHRFGILAGNEVAAKTGTTQNNSDGWFMGFTKDLTTGVWVGGDDRSIHFRTLELGQGSRMALPIWALYMNKVYEDKSLGITKGPFPAPKSATVLEKINCDRYKIDQVAGEDSVSNYVMPSSPF
jgi:penicillin-binding protein 1A